MDPRMIGAYISNMRKNRNLTQLELAQMLNISHQAISKWERGESLPDISILPQLSRVFEVTIDELLAGDAGAADTEVAADVVKLDKVTVMNRTVDVTIQPSSIVDKSDASVDQMIRLAPFISQETLEAMVARIEGNISLHNMMSLAPFLTKTTLGTLAARFASEQAGDCQPYHLVGLAPFLEPTALTGLIRQCAVEGWEPAILVSLAPFLEQSELIRLVEHSETNVSPEQLGGLAPFLPRATLDRIVLRNM